MTLFPSGLDVALWPRVKAAFDAAMAGPPEDRIACLQRVESDPAIVAEVLSLLDAHDRAEQFIDTPALSLPGAPEAFDDLIEAMPQGGDAGLAIGARCGAYEVIGHLADGGMGSVFLARRVDATFEQQVAIKLVRADLATPALSARLLRERRILAALDHPNIARLIDGGSTDTGVPYAVMDYVDGVRVDEYCDKAALTVRQRVELFSIICGAVHHAHQHLVVHRDLKAGNILVTRDGVPKLLDFGIAKLLAPDPLDGAGASHTRTGWRALTLDSASPEQVRGQRVTIASDVYALGALLYRLLTGVSPYQSAASDERALEHAICEIDPVAPSRVAPPDRQRFISGDLDLIVLKTLQKAPSRRYASVAQLADDLDRQLTGRPVAAAPDSWTYRLKKFVKRHRVAVAAAAVGFATLLAGAAGTVYQKRAADRQRVLAERRFNDVRQLAHSMMFELPDSMQNAPGTTATRKLIVAKSLEYLDVLAGEAGDDVSLQRELASVYEKMGEVQGDIMFANLGDMKGALSSYQKAVEIRERLGRMQPGRVEDQVALAAMLRRLGGLQLQSLGDVDAALASCRRAVSVTEAALRAAPDNGGATEELIGDYDSLGDVFSGAGTAGNLNDPEAGFKNHRRALDLAQQWSDRAPGDAGRQLRVASLSRKSGEDLVKAGDRTGALALYTRAFAIFQERAKDPSNGYARRRFAVMQRFVGDVLLFDEKYDEALPYYQRELRLTESISAADPDDVQGRMFVAGANGNLGLCLIEMGRVREGVAAITQALAIMEAVLAKTKASEVRTNIALLTMWRGEGEERLGQWPAAIASYGRTVEFYSNVAGASPSDAGTRVALAQSRVRLGSAYLKAGDTHHAETEFQASRAMASALVAASPRNTEALYALADVYAGLGDLASSRAATPDARAWYEKSLSTWRQVPNPAHVSPKGFDVTRPQDIERRLARLSGRRP